MPIWSIIATLFLSLTLLSACQQTARDQYYERKWSEEDRQILLDGLQKSLDVVFEETRDLNSDAWNYQESEDKWSIALIVEHLIVHDELFTREVKVLTGLPPFPKQYAELFADDEMISSYRKITPANSGPSPQHLAPMGRWCSKEETLEAYNSKRQALIDFVKTTDADLRAYYTSSGRGPTQYRDAHQLLLISIAHTQRHTKQIRNIKESMVELR